MKNREQRHQQCWCSVEAQLPYAFPIFNIWKWGMLSLKWLVSPLSSTTGFSRVSTHSSPRKRPREMLPIICPVTKGPPCACWMAEPQLVVIWVGRVLRFGWALSYLMSPGLLVLAPESFLVDEIARERRCWGLYRGGTWKKLKRLAAGRENNLLFRDFVLCYL